jgi:hypothetical protein
MLSTKKLSLLTLMSVFAGTHASSVGPIARRFLGGTDDAARDDDNAGDDCSTDHLSQASNQCAYVQSSCGDSVNFIDYLSLLYCNKTYGFAWPLLVLWLVLLISLLATTADYYFVPALEFLSFEVLELSPEVAGITLLALGNGAPDVFGALAGIAGQDDFEVALGALAGASIFISSVVLGTVLLVADPQARVNPESFRRDVLAYIATVFSIVFVALDGKVTIYEASCLLLLYVIYVTYVVITKGRSGGKNNMSLVNVENKIGEATSTISTALSASLIECETNSLQEDGNTNAMTDNPLFHESSVLLHRRSISAVSATSARRSSLSATSPPPLQGLSWQPICVLRARVFISVAAYC